MKKIFTTIFLCAGLFIYAQTGTVSGNINDNSKTITLPRIPVAPVTRIIFCWMLDVGCWMLNDFYKNTVNYLELKFLFL